jgi:hypothetical protein
MNPKNTLMLVVVAAALFGFIFFIEPLFRKPQPLPTKVIEGLRPESVTGLQVLLPGQKIAVVRSNGGWQMLSPRSYPAQSQLVESLVRAAALIRPQTRISAQELKGRSANEEFGFDTPQATLVFQQGGADSLTLKLGSLTMPGDQMYAQVVGLANVDVIDAEFFKKFVPRQANDWRDTSFIALTNSSFDRLTVASGSQLFELTRDDPHEPWRMTKPVQSRADNPRIDSLLFALQNLRITHFVSDDPKVDLESFGLQPAALELKFDRGTNHALAVQFGKSPTNDDTQIYARLNGDSSIVEVPRDRVLPWTAGFQEFRDSHLVRFNGQLPDVIESVSSNKDSFTVQRQPDNTWRVTKPIDLPADTNLMRSFLATLVGMEVERINNHVAVDDGVVLDDPRFGLATPARRYIIKRSGATNETVAELDFGLVKDDHIFVRRGDCPEESSVYALALSNYTKLPANAMQLRARRIWDFSETNVEKITIRQGGKSQELIHKGQGKWSIAAGSQGMIDELQVEVGAQELGFLEAQNWIQRGDEDRARFGFGERSLQITVELKENGHPRMLTLGLGGIAPDGLRYGDARMDDGQNWVFELPPVLLERVISFFNIHESTN